MLPKIIHQIWLQGLEHFKEKRKQEYQWTLEVQAFFPDWEYHLWSEDDIKTIINNELPQLLPLLNASPNMAFTADLGRFAFLFKYGGVYMDTDYMILKSFAHLLLQPNTEFVCLYYDAFSPFDSKILSNWRHNNCFTASVKQSPILTELINAMIQYGPYKKSDNSYAYTENCSLRNYDKVMKAHISDPNMLVISNHDLEPLHAFNQNRTCKSAADCRKEFPSAYAIHMGVGSWIPGIESLKAVGVVYGEMRDNWQITAIVLLCFTILFLVLFAVTLYKLIKTRKSSITEDSRPMMKRNA